MPAVSEDTVDAQSPRSAPIAGPDFQVNDGAASATECSIVSRIVLTGFMGAGKTTVGPLIAARLGWRFLDLDAAIEAEHGASIAELFAQRGEPWFRQVEHEAVLGRLESDRLVLALGGGAVEDARTRSLLLSSKGTYLVHLEAALETVLARCRGTEDLRPVLRDHAHLESRYLRRLPLYREAHLSFAVDALTPEAVAEALIARIGALGG